MKKKVLLILMFITMFVIGNRNVYADVCKTRGYKTVCSYEISIDSLTNPSNVYLYFDNNSTLVHYHHGQIDYDLKNINNSPDILIHEGQGNYSEHANYINVSSLNNSCPQNIYFYRGATTKIGGHNYYWHWRTEESQDYQVNGTFADHEWITYNFVDSCKESEVTKDDDEVNCSLLSDDIISMINNVMNIIRIAIPLLLIGLITYDFAMATFANDDKAMNKAKQNVIKRIIIAIVIFFVPTLINLMFNIVNEVWENTHLEICGLDKE